MISAGLAFLSAFAFSIAAIQNNRFKIYGISASIICLIITTGMAIGFSGGSGWIPAMQWKIPFAPNKKVAQFFLVNPVENTIPSAVAQVDISVPIQMRMVMGGEFGILDDENTEARIVSQDGTAPTFLFHDAGNVKKYPQLDDTQAASGYIALKASGIKNPDVMVIGVGGGIDIMIALYQNASSVTAVELNKAMIKMGTETYSDYTGGLFHDSRVNLFNEDGRTHLMRTNKKFDLIQLSGVDTFTALSTGAYTLSESYLYTVEAIQKMYSQLNPEGIINYSRFITEDKPRETLRLANTAFSAMEKLGVKEPWRHIAILQAKDWASTMIKNKPFTANEIIALKEFSDSEGFTGMVFDPTTSNINEITGKTESIKKMREKYFYLLRSSAIDRDFFVNDYIYDIYPATDDKPFFFDYFKISKISIDTMDFTDNFYAEALADFPVGHMILISSLLIVSIFAFLMIVWPLKFLSRHTINRKIRNKTFFYFSSLGIGYMFIEIGMMQKFVLFLGHPIYAMSVVLGGMLTFSGFGSLYSEKFSNINRLTLIKIAAVIIGCTTFNALLLSNTLENLQGASITIRILTTLTLLAPTAFVLGMLFPLGIKLLQKNAAQLIPWGWGINGFMSVLSSILAIMLAMSYGFTWVFWAAGFIYCFGLMQAPLEQKQ